MVRLAVYNRLKLLVAVLRSHYASEFVEWPCRFPAVQFQLVRALQVHPETADMPKYWLSREAVSTVIPRFPA
jgi:hypothetical protein